MRKIEPPLPSSDVRRIPRLGDPTCVNSCPQRQQICRHECVQRGTDVHHGGRHLICDIRQARCLLRDNLLVHSVLYDHHAVSRVCT